MPKHPAWPPYPRKVRVIYGMVIFVTLYTGAGVFAQDQGIISGDVAANQVRAAWMKGSSNRALEVLDQGMREFPHYFPLQKLRGDILTTIRWNQEAVK